ncbi:MAG: cytochrome C, partial [Desulfobacterium sp.]|nr:cytochrome C [Desulfobacterium sp.]
IANNYNAYVSTGTLTGTQATSYLALVPFERGTNNPTTLSTTTTAGPSGTSNVMCLTCHRAHASAFPNAGRWDFTATFLASSHPLATDGGVTGNDVLNSYYGRNITTDFGAYQRSLCNKCHLQD